MPKVTIPSFTLNNGVKMPALGYGTWLGLNDKNEFDYSGWDRMVETLSYCIDIGYRHIDTAHLYRVEPDIGQVIKKKIADKVVTREELFITTKVWQHFHREADVEVSVRGSLRRLGLDYLDQVLVHWPMAISHYSSRRPQDKMLLWLLAAFVVANCAEHDGGKAPKIALNDGNFMPSLGLGTFLGFDQNGQKVAKELEVENAVSWALSAGYRMIDTAALYNNEEQIGRGIRMSSVPRENIFLVTKLGSNEKRDVVGSLKKSLERLNMSYVDLYLIHNPISFKPNDMEYDIIDYVDTWKQMEEVKRQGLARSIGISNFNISQMERLLEKSEIKPAVLQVEVNLNLAQNKIVEFCNRHDIAVMAYSPFGSLFTKDSAPPPPRADDPVLKTLAETHKKTPAQIVLRYLVQRGLAPIPKSVSKERIEQNIDIFDFTLTAQEMENLGKFNKDYRLIQMSFWQDHPYYPFEKKDVPDPSPFEPKSVQQ